MEFCDIEVKIEPELEIIDVLDWLDSDETSNYTDPITDCSNILPEQTTLQTNQLSQLKTVHTFKCNICEEVFNEISSLSSHIPIHDSIKPPTIDQIYQCEICEVNFKNLSLLKRHLVRHQGKDRKRNFKCIICEKAFFAAHHLKAHILRHDINKTQKCESCGKFINTLIGHKCKLPQVETTQKSESFKCDICDRVFGKIGSLKRHKPVHNSIKPPPIPAQPQICKCEICDSNFTSLASLKSHIQKRICTARERIFKCDMCDKTYLQAHNLKDHKLHKHYEEED